MIRVALLVALALLAAPAMARGQDITEPGQRAESSPLVLALVHEAQGFWAQRNVSNPACAGSDPKTWRAPTLRSGGDDAWGLGEATTCQIWLSDDLVQSLIHPGELDNSYDDMVHACDIIAHEVGHANGLAHSESGIMAADGWGRPVSSAPSFCVSGARARLLSIARRHGRRHRQIVALRQTIRQHLRDDTFL